MPGRIFTMVKKEFRQIKRDKRTLALIFIFPLFLLVIFGYAISFDVKNIKVAVYDQDRTAESREFISMLGSSEYFRIIEHITDPHDVNRFLDEKYAQCVIVIPYGMSRDIASGKTSSVQFLVDGVDGNTATVIMNYMNAATGFYTRKLSGEILSRAGTEGFIPVDPEMLFWYNPELNTTKFLVPGLLTMILLLAAVILTCMSIVREKELGSMEQLYVSPLTSIEMIISKIIPYTFVALLVASFTLAASNLLFGVQVKGSFFLLFLSTLIFLITALGIGIFISTIADSQQVAFQISALFTLLPTFMLSGFVFPIESMPWFLQIISNITPAKFYIITLRYVLIKGTGIEAIWPQLIYLLIFAAITLLIATIRTMRSRPV